MTYAIFYDMLLVHTDLPLSFQIAMETCFASNSASIMSRSFIAPQVLLRLQDISVDCLNREDCNSELDDALDNDLEEVELDLSGEESGVNSSSEDDDNDPPNQGQVNQVLIEKDGTVLQALATSHLQRERLQQQNILSFKPGPTAFATSRIMESSPLSSFRVLFDEEMLIHIRKCTVAEANRISDKINRNVTLDELDMFIELVIARGILGRRDLPVEILGESTWEFPMFSNTLSRQRLKEIMQFLFFDLKSDRCQRVIYDKFCLASSL